MLLVVARQKNVQRFVFNALQWITEEIRRDHGASTPNSMLAEGRSEDIGIENSLMRPQENQRSGTNCSAILNGEKEQGSKQQSLAKAAKRKKKRKKKRTLTRPISPKLSRSKSVGAMTIGDQVLLPVSPVRKITKADINRLATRHYRKNPYAEQLEKELRMSKGKVLNMKDIEEKLKVFSKPKRVTKPFLDMQKTIPANKRRKRAFGIGGSRFVDESVYKTNSTPGPGAYSDVSKSTLTSCGIKMAKYVPMNPIDYLMLQASKTPGPADYFPQLPAKSGGKFSTANPPDHITLIQRKAAKTPGPNQYKMSSLGENIRGGKMANYVPVHPIDLLMKRAAETPGPGQYGIPELPQKEGVKFSTTKQSGNFDRLIARAKRSPGPGAYDVRRGLNYVDPVRTTTFPMFAPPNSLDILVRRTSRLPGPDQYDALSPIKDGKVTNSVSSILKKDPVF